MNPHRRLFAATMLATSMLSSACGSSEPKAALHGMVPVGRATVDPVSLPDVTNGQTGKRLTFKATPGHLLAVYFGYTQCPDLCPTTMADLSVAFDRIGAKANKVDVAFVTVDPERDTPKVLTNFLQHFFKRNYHALRTTKPQELKAAEAALDASSEIAKTNGKVEVGHSSIMAIIDEHSTLRVAWPFGVTGRQMADDLDLLLR